MSEIYRPPYAFDVLVRSEVDADLCGGFDHALRTASRLRIHLVMAVVAIAEIEGEQEGDKHAVVGQIACRASQLLLREVHQIHPSDAGESGIRSEG
eukprot:325490-Prymnesium_polylepis.1